MKIIQRIIILHLLFAICLINELFACDIAVVSAGASSSGRPFIWKNRDYQLSAREEITYTKARKNDVGASLRVIGETYDQLNIKIVSGGVNDKGFAIANTTVVEDPLREMANINHILLEIALEKCETLEDFESFLNKWFNYYLFVISGNFAVIDAYGGAAIYEVWSNGSNFLTWEKYDANEAENGFVVRANSHLTEGWVARDGGSSVRYERAHELLTGLAQKGELTPRNVMRVVGKDVAGDCDKFAEDCEACYKYDKDYEEGNPDPHSFNTDKAISRNATTSSYAIDGANTFSDIPLITLYCVLGEPSFTPAVPYFLSAKKIPYYAKAGSINFFGFVVDLGIGCFLNNASMRIQSRNDLYSNNGLAMEWVDQTIDYERLLEVQKWVFPLEDIVYDRTENFLEYLRGNPDQISEDVLYRFSLDCARYVYKNYRKETIDEYPFEFVAPWEE